MLGFLSKKGVLGMNARNLLYIDKLNPEEALFFAKDKIAVKKYLEVRDIPVPKTLDIFPPKRGVYTFPDSYWDKYEKKGFVIKPNTGSIGSGITVIERFDKDQNMWQRIDGKFLDSSYLSNEIVKIWLGEYSNDNKPETVLIEERIVPNDYINEIFQPTGLPDIRIVVRNMIPIMAMLRVPTGQSEGKANLDKGAYGVAVDISSGRCIRAFRNGKFFTSANGFRLKDVVIPFWEEIITLASRLQKLTNIGFLACDFVVTKDGPLMLEINGRGGLKIQIPNKIGLQERLDLVANIKVQDEYQAVDILHNLFGNKKSEEEAIDKPVIGMEEKVSLLLKDGEVDIDMRINTEITENYLDENIFKDVFGETKSGHLKIKLADQKINLRILPKDFTHYEYKGILGKHVAKDFLIDIDKYKNDENSSILSVINKTGNLLSEVEKITSNLKSKLASYTTLSYFQQIPLRKFVLTDKEFEVDEELYHLHQTISFLSNLMPTNVESEKEKFVSAHGQYDPIFDYKIKVPISYCRKKLYSLQVPQGRLYELFNRKKNELLLKLDILEVVGKDNEEFTRRSTALFGEIQEDLVLQSHLALKSAVLDHHREIYMKKNEVEDYLKQLSKDLYNLDLNIVWKPNMASVASLSGGKTLMLRSGSKWSAWRIRSMFEHEISVHYLRYLNALKSPLKILQIGTGFYANIEEGLAVYRQQKFIPMDKKRYYSPFTKYLLIKDSLTQSFSQLYKSYPFKSVSIGSKFNDILRVKRGIKNTAEKGAFMKDIIYLDGWKKVQNLPHETREKLFYGKMNLDDLQDLSFYVDPHALIYPQDL